MWRCRSTLSSITRCRYRAVVGEKIGENVCSVAPTQDSWGRSSKKKTPFITFVLGGPGTGKGTQCEKIAESFGFTHLSAGELIRREISSNSENGLLKTITDGKIVPSDVTVKLIQREMRSSNNYKFLIDGFPRSEENRIAFERFVGLEPDIVLFFDCPEEEMIQRVLSRNQGRADDNIETIKKRLHVFSSLNLPVVEYYASKGKLRKINAVGTVDEIFKQVHPIFAAFEDENHRLIPQKQARGYLFENSSWCFTSQLMSMCQLKMCD